MRLIADVYVSQVMYGQRSLICFHDVMPGKNLEAHVWWQRLWSSCVDIVSSTFTTATVWLLRLL